MMRIMNWTAFLLLTTLLAACGAKDSGKGGGAPGGSGSTPRAAASGNATAEEVAEEARGDVDCPADIDTPARAASAPVDDVVGVRPGLTYEEAANVVMCTGELMVVTADNSRGFNMQTYGQTIRQGFTARPAKPRIEKTSKQIMQEMQDDMIARGGNARRQDMQPGESKWYVGTMGMPGQERVVNAAREEWFAEGRNPTVASVEQALLKKYGTATRSQKSGGNVYLSWAYDPMSRPVTETSPLFSQCSNGQASPDAGVNLSPDCGILVTAQITPATDNPDLAKILQVSVVNQAGGYDAITATEQSLQQLDNERKAKQVEEAGKNADAPQL